MLEFKKTILEKVSFDLELFEKELRKAISGLIPDEIKQLKAWCVQNFPGKYLLIIRTSFNEAGY